MYSFQIIILLMSVAILLVAAAQKLRIPYPIALVFGGMILGFIPLFNEITFDPTLILTVVLPPILYYAAYGIAFREFRHNLNEIFSLALGLVVATTFLIGLLFKWLFPELPWALAFTFGAIVSPPDAVTATTILKRFNISSRLLTILEGESLINDAFALLLYKLGVAALLSGVFSWSDAGVEFVKILSGGVLIGLVMGFTVQFFSTYVLSPVIGILFSFTIPYMTFFLANALGGSGILAVVVNGLILSRLALYHHDSYRHVIATVSWDMLTILLNCFVFVLIGIQLGIISQKMSYEQMLVYSGYGVLIMLSMLFIRLVWIFAGHGITYLRAHPDATMATCCRRILSEGLVMGFSGMLGIVSLTAVLALPYEIEGRETVIFITFVVILLTLIFPGFLLPYLLKWLKMDTHDGKQLELKYRNHLLKIAEEQIDSFEEFTKEERTFLKSVFRTRHAVREYHSAEENHKLELARQRVLETQSEALKEMLEQREIDHKLWRLLDLEIDLEQSLSIMPDI